MFVAFFQARVSANSIAVLHQMDPPVKNGRRPGVSSPRFLRQDLFGRRQLSHFQPGFSALFHRLRRRHLLQRSSPPRSSAPSPPSPSPLSSAPRAPPPFAGLLPSCTRLCCLPPFLYRLRPSRPAAYLPFTFAVSVSPPLSAVSVRFTVPTAEQKTVHTQLSALIQAKMFTQAEIKTRGAGSSPWK